MSQVLQVRCPHCQNVLRIPAEWLTTPVRCKFCQTVFQGKARPDAAAPQKSAVAAGRPSRPAPGRRLPHASRSSPSMKALPAALLVSALCVGIVFAGHFSWVLMRGTEASTHASNSGKNEKKADDSAGKNDDNSGKKTDDGPKKPPVEVADPDKGKPGKEKTPDTSGPDVDKFKKDKDPPMEVKVPPETEPIRKRPDEPPPLREDPKRVVELANMKAPNPDDPYPRRALLVSVNDYLFWNTVSHGSSASAKPPFPGSSTSTLVELLSKPPFSIADDQITELSDGIPSDPKSTRRPRDPLRQVVKDTIDEFLNASRPQDRVIVLFAGHIFDGDKESYLVPIEGNKDDVNTLIPLSWLYEKLVACKAKQKLLILDVCRYPQQGLERPGAEEMSEQLDGLLMTPPAGVQIWASCIKGQKSYELARGSVFLEALCSVLRKDYAKDVSIQNKQLPLSLVVPEVNQRMKELLDPLTLTQVSRLSGFTASESNPAAVYNANEKMPPRLTIPQPKLEGGDAAGAAFVNEILEEINRQPTVRAGDSLPRTMPTFSAKALADYKADYPSWDGLKDLIAKEPEKYALRKAVLEAFDVMNDSKKLQMIRRIPSTKGQPLDPKVKSSFLDKQKEPALKIFDLRQALKNLKAVGETSYEKESKRWQAHYDFTVARVQARMLFIFEYNYLIGTIRQDLPALEPGQNGWTLVSRQVPQVQTKEAEAKDLAKQLKRAWKRVGDSHPDTPWAIIAVREQMNAMGLEWKATKE